MPTGAQKGVGRATAVALGLRLLALLEATPHAVEQGPGLPDLLANNATSTLNNRAAVFAWEAWVR